MSSAPPRPLDRESWRSTAGFLLAAVGAAVGLGNLWRFSYTASRGGGAAFVILYVGFVLVVGLPLLTAELAIGRHTRLSPIRALARIGSRRWAWVGWMFVLVGFFVLSSYSIIMGWTARLLLDSVRGALPTDPAAHFAQISAGASAVPPHLISMAITVLVVSAGIRAGIERAARLLMPVLFLLLVLLAGWAATLSGASAGYGFYLRPSVKELLNADVIAAAAGQAFFSLSLGMGGLITLASYMERGRGNLARQAGTIALADTSVAIVGGLVVFPVIYHLGLQEQVGASPIGALFITLPGAFSALETGGTLVATVFFFTLYIAALTSATVMLEVVVAGVIDAWGWPRRRTTLMAGAAIALFGIPGALSTNWLAFVDKMVGEVFLIVGGLLTALLTGWVWSHGAGEELSRGFRFGRLVIGWLWLLRAVIPLVLFAVLYLTLRQAIPLVVALFQ